jgi:acetolactate synthase I/II/III large subunit
MTTVAQYISKYLEKKKLKNIPIFQGGAIMNTINEIGKNKKFKYFCPYHEQALSMEVDAMSRLNGRANVGLVTSGPGATNLITGVCCSYYDSIPSVYFTGQVGQIHIKKKETVRQRGFQETDVISIFKPITKYCVQIKEPHDIKYELDKAFYLAENGRPGPCLIDLPYNIQRSKIHIKKLKKFSNNKIKIKKKSSLGTNKILNLLKSKKKILVIAGGGVRLSNQINNFQRFIKKFNLPFVTTWAAQDICSHDDKNFYGSIGRHAYKSANELAKEADLILTFGVRFSPKIISKEFGQNAKIVSVDIDKKELDHCLIKIDEKINIDLKDFFPLIMKKKIKNNNENWLKDCKKIKKNFFYQNYVDFKFNRKSYVDPYRFINDFSKLLSSNSVVYTDAGCNLCWCMQGFKIKYGQRLISAWGNSPMGYSVAAGIGGKIFNPKKPVYSLIGDGAFMINLQELQFIMKNKTNLKIVILDNRIYGNTLIGSKELFNNPSYGNDEKNGYYPPDIKEISKCFKINYFKLNNDLYNKNVIKKFIKSKSNSILHVKISPDQNLIDYSNT